MFTYAERHGLLSEWQSGFRAGRDTHNSVQTLVTILEDARLSSQNLYLLNVDFSSAFNMMDHDTLLRILYDLGFPTDAVDVIRDLYTNATTSVESLHGSTPPILIDRGTIQGDTLSPLLFILYIEPLLRWLQAGDNGYTIGSAAPELPRTPLRSWIIAALAYADDLIIMASTITSMYAQIAKLDLFSKWAHMPVNAKKTTITGILHKASSTRLYGRPHPSPLTSWLLSSKTNLNSGALLSPTTTPPFHSST
jgi:hypothetical protein